MRSAAKRCQDAHEHQPCQKAGVTIAEYKPLLQRDPDIESAFDRVTNEWLSQKKAPCWPSRWAKPDWKTRWTNAISMQRMPKEPSWPSSLLFRFSGKDGYMADVTRHGSNAPGGVMETIIYEAFQTFRSEGVHYGSLGVAPLAGLDDEKASLVERLLRICIQQPERLLWL